MHHQACAGSATRRCEDCRALAIHLVITRETPVCEISSSKKAQIAAQIVKALFHCTGDALRALSCVHRSSHTATNGHEGCTATAETPPGQVNGTDQDGPRVCAHENSHIDHHTMLATAFLAGLASAAPPVFTENITVYHVYPGNYGLAPVNMVRRRVHTDVQHPPKLQNRCTSCFYMIK